MKNTVLFDLDGTLVDSLEDLKDATNYTMNKLGLPQRSLDEVRNFVGNGVDMLIKRACGNAQYDFSKASEYFREYYNVNLCNKTKPYEGIVDVINELKMKGFKLGVVTNKPQLAAEKIVNHYFNNSFDVIIGADLSKRRKKPYNDPVDTALSAIKEKKDTTIFVGDSDVDLATAKNMDMTFIGVTWGFRNEEIFANEKYFVRNSQQLLNLCCNFLQF